AVGQSNLRSDSETTRWDINDLTCWAAINCILDDSRTIDYPSGISPKVGYDVHVNRRSAGNTTRYTNISLPWGRSIARNDSRPAVRGETNAQKQGEQKRPGPFHDYGLPLVLAIRLGRLY